MTMSLRQVALLCVCAALGGAGIALALALATARVLPSNGALVSCNVEQGPEIGIPQHGLNQAGCRRVYDVIPSVVGSCPARETIAEENLLPIPYRMMDAHCGHRPFLNAVVPKRMVLVNLFTGQEEILDFNTTRYGVAAYVPAVRHADSIVGVFVISDATFRLIERDGTRCEFDAAGYLTDVHIALGRHVHFEYISGLINSFVETPYAVSSHGSDRMQFLNATIPKKIEVTDLIHERTEVLVFSRDERIAGYVPEDRENSRYRMLALMSDTSLRLPYPKTTNNGKLLQDIWGIDTAERGCAGHRDPVTV